VDCEKWDFLKNFYNLVRGNFFIAEPKYDILYTIRFLSSSATILQADPSTLAPKNASYGQRNNFGARPGFNCTNFQKKFSARSPNFFTKTYAQDLCAVPSQRNFFDTLPFSDTCSHPNLQNFKILTIIGTLCQKDGDKMSRL
jgi:hypothetical protein